MCEFYLLLISFLCLRKFPQVFPLPVSSEGTSTEISSVLQFFTFSDVRDNAEFSFSFASYIRRVVSLLNVCCFYIVVECSLKTSCKNITNNSLSTRCEYFVTDDFYTHHRILWSDFIENCVFVL